MEIKTLKIEIPKGYEIDQEKSTFENIVFKKVDDIVIKWNECHNGVEIKANDEHFVLDGGPSYYMSWDDAMRFYNRHKGHTWNLPTVEQLQVVSKYFDKINKVIKQNGGFELSKLIYWSNESRDNTYSWFVKMINGDHGLDYAISNYYVRSVVTL